MSKKRLAYTIQESIVKYAKKKSGLNCWGFLYEPKKPKLLEGNRKNEK